MHGTAVSTRSLGTLAALAAFGAFGLVACAASAGCGSASHPYLLDVGGGDDAGFSPDALLGSDDPGASSAFDAHIEQSHVAVTFVTVSCSGPCADVVAVATGGQKPYSFRWEDGSTSAARHVCPTKSTRYVVTATDTGTTGELGRPSQSVKVPLAASVLACPDGGTDSGITGTGDAGAGQACFSNPSFEGTPANDAVDATPWVACGNQATIENPSLPFPAQPLLQPTDGNTALFLRATDGVPPAGAVSEPLCAPMHAGLRYHLTLDIASTPETNFGGASPVEGLQIWGSSSSCAETELLWSSPLGGASWTSECATLAPTMEVTYVTLVAYQAPDAGPAVATGNLQVDHMVAVAACP